ncbi:CpsD/CapB family tyrosine-protein kinase [Sphingobium sp. PNB]|uniref:CpsD/CapB family tyrosine-protein kinase n=1 Tax=Sphingobium sp. PNB TaxID=863934 RepID=UPI001CA406C9|nr:CpsD/CapB family tyrosine-protein kinase [Sphingobium sp. PNB]MCB4858137.1 CpsD/CapB family tyrosine-protein kinase [Sphingobium sp. PNB]
MVTGLDVVVGDLGYRHPEPKVGARPCDPVTLDPAHLAANGICALDHLDARSRSFILLRTQIMNGFFASGGRIMAVTSTQPGNGKTFVATNLAMAISRVHPVVLIDLDLAKPALGSRLGLEPHAGVDDYLAGAAPLPLCRQEVDELRLSVLPVRQRRLDPAGLLSGDRFATLFPALADPEGDPVFIVDSPPTLAIDEILAIGSSVEGVLMVVEEGQTHADELQEAMALLEPRPIIGTVLNKSIGGIFRRRKKNYYYGERLLLPSEVQP